MNTFGTVFRISIFGESHGECTGVLVDGCPAGIRLSQSDFTADLLRRKGGEFGTTKRKEEDIPLLKSGVFNGKSTGAPILIMFKNKNADSGVYAEMRSTPRPGHADFTAMKKFQGFNDYRGAGHFSGRITLGLVAAGVIAKKIISPICVRTRILEVDGSKDIKHAIANAKQNSVGGIVEFNAINIPAGLGEPFFNSAESLFSHLAFSIPGIKGIEFGVGFGCAKMRGSEFNDEILNKEGKTRTNNAGGINGGITNGNEIVFRVAVRPTASIPLIQKTINLKTGMREEISVKGRHDKCIALRIPPILEAVGAIALADLMLIRKTQNIRTEENLR